MNITVRRGEVQKARDEAIVVNLFEGITAPAGATAAVDSASGGLIRRVLDTGDFSGRLGQILVLYDVLGITMGRTPRFVQNFQQGHDSPLAALQAFVSAVKDGSYPAPEHCFS